MLEKKAIKTASVGFLPDFKEIEYGDPEKGEPGRTFNKQELLEISLCTIPANPNAMIQKGMITEKQARDYGWIQEKDGPEMIELTIDEVIGKPYPTEHACRIRQPGQFKRIRRQNKARKHDGKWFDIIWGVKDVEGKEVVMEQAFRYPIEDWTETQAKKHCDESDGIRFEPAEPKEEETAPQIHIVNLTKDDETHYLNNVLEDLPDEIDIEIEDDDNPDLDITIED